MAWTNYRGIVDRFSHIDAEFVRATTELSAEGGTAEVVVRFYPWWEHPLYLAAINRNEQWGFSESARSGIRDVRVRAVAPCAVHLSRRQLVVDWQFEEEHPVLWQFGAPTTVYVNASFDREALIDGLLSLQHPNVTARDLRNHIDMPSSRIVPFGLTVPVQLHESVLTVFEKLDVPVVSRGPVTAVTPAVAFLMGDGDYMIARDFEVDVPDFIHRPEWFQPSESGNVGGRS